MNLFTLLERSARRFPDRGAVFVGTQAIHRWGELHERALSIAAGLRERHRAGNRVAIVSENGPEYPELLFAVWAAGMVAVPANYKLHAREIAQIVADAQADVAFVAPQLADEFGDAVDRARCRTVVIGSAAYDELLALAPAAPSDVAPDSPAWLFYTSGTTGRSKGAMLSHRNLMAMTIDHLADIDNLDETMSQIHAAPMSHGSGMYMLPSVARAARQVIPASRGFDPAEFLDLCDEHPACSVFLAPTMVQRLRLQAERTQRAPPRGLRTIVYGGGPMYVEELKKSLATFGQVFVQIYGQGESPMTITGLRRADHAGADDEVLGSVGWPRTGVEVRVVDADGRDVPVGETGEIVCRGDVVMVGYWNNPQASAEALRDGWLWTGDMGSFDERGCLTLRDRSKDVVISGGANIYPREVEEALLAHPDVAEVCVVGECDDAWGEVVVAFVVRAPASAVTAEALDAHCLQHIARFKRPKRYVFVDALPKNSYGKVLKRELRERLTPSHPRPA